jgi:hypothetical protein
VDEANPPSHVLGLVDAAGSRTLEAAVTSTGQATLYRRRIALIDVDEGSGSQPFSPRQQTLEQELPQGIIPANSYLVDIFRVAGGAMHTYCFHGTVNDDFQWNVLNVQPVAHVKPTARFASEADYLSVFEQTPESKAAGHAPDTLEATWRMVRFEKDTRGGVSEEALLGKNFDSTSPRRFTKLHLLGAKGLGVLKADVLQTKCAEAENTKNNWTPPLAGYRWTCLYARKTAPAQPLASAFAAVIEPYLGEPYIASAKLLDVAANEADAQRSVALEVQLKNGRADFVFADGRPDRMRQVGSRKVSGEYAFLSTDAQGFRQATLVGGTLLQTPEITLALERPAYVSKVVDFNLTNQTVVTDTPWFCALPGQTLTLSGPDRVLNFTLAQSAEPTPGGSRLTFTRDAILAIQAGTGAHLSAIHIGDAIRASCFVNVRRAAAGAFLVEGNSDVQIHVGSQPARALTAKKLAQHRGSLLLMPDGAIAPSSTPLR